MLTHSLSRLIKLSNNPSGKNVKLLASSSLFKHRIIKFILFNYWSIQISYELMFLRLVIALKTNLGFSYPMTRYSLKT